ncbi:four-carbon acid sugar kinase family protein [Bosea sp. ASV33]|uniref:four-carbon acid sugar kinase family protein n=1 Tax=Bosea sp. ASV33 TaxID=2795106 RepID=UPI0018EC911C|nr:four-carbon acid sugar kinase family protein [Bosea sp. ASV33]
MATTNSLQIGIVADDLTSAADGAGPFLKRGFTPHIHRGSHAQTAEAVVAVDTGSRGLPEGAAGKATGQAIAALAGRSLLYKTMDSTLRGHVRVEIAAAFNASGRDRLVIAPAFPAAGRQTVGGIQFVGGRPVSETDYGRDPLHPARTSRLLDLVDPTLGPVTIASQRMSDEAVLAALAHSRILVLDADRQEVLDRRVALLIQSDSILWVGSPGLAQALATQIAALPKRPSAPQPLARRVLIVIGSANAVSRQQCEFLAENGVQVAQHSTDLAADAEIACLRAPQARGDDPAAILAALTDEVRAAVRAWHFDAIFATGGDTMGAVLQRLSISSLALSGEFEPGFPFGYAAMAEAASPLLLAMKAGGFGHPATLLHAALRLRLRLPQEATR